MEQTYMIPISYKSGVYHISKLTPDGNTLELHYSDYGDIVTYKLPDSEYSKKIRLYNIEKELLDDTLKATYDSTECLKMITVNRNDNDELLYIHYGSIEETKKELEHFAKENAQCILDKISMCKDTVSRLFIEYFNDGEYMDFHAKLGTEAEKTALEKQYPEYADIADSCGDYSSEILDGDNNRLKVMILCGDNEDFNCFTYVVDIMAKFIEKQAPALLNKAEDFKYLCCEYD